MEFPAHDLIGAGFRNIVHELNLSRTPIRSQGFSAKINYLLLRAGHAFLQTHISVSNLACHIVELFAHRRQRHVWMRREDPFDLRLVAVASAG